MLGRIDVVDPAGQHRDRTGGQAALMRRAVYAASQARDHQAAGLAQVARQVAGEPLPGGRGDAGADDPHARPGQQLGPAPGPDHRRRRIQGGEQGREGRLAGAEQHRAQGLAGVQLGLGLGRGGRAQRCGAAGAAGDLGQGVQGAGGIAPVAAQQLGEGDRAHGLGARQAQPGQPLVGAERARRPHQAAGGAASAAAALALEPTRGSWPLSRRAMFWWWRM